MVVMSGDDGCWCALFGTLVGVSVLSVMWLECFGNQFTTMVVCVWGARVWSVRLHHLIIELGMYVGDVLYAVCYVCVRSVVLSWYFLVLCICWLW